MSKKNMGRGGGAATGAAMGSVVPGIGTALGAGAGYVAGDQLFGGGDEGYGRFYDKISANDADAQEDANENTGPLDPRRRKQQREDRWGQGNEGKMPMGRRMYRRSDRIEDRNEQAGHRRRNLGMDGAADRAYGRGLWWSDWEPGKAFKDPIPRFWRK